MPAPEGETVPAETPSAFQPPENPTRWQRFLIWFRSILLWLLDAIERHLGA